MRLVDGDELLRKWNELSIRGRTEFDQVIMCEPTVDAIVITERKKHVSDFSDLFENDENQVEEIYCPDCVRKRGFSWHVYQRWDGLPRKYKCECCGREYYENEDE